VYVFLLHLDGFWGQGFLVNKAIDLEDGGGNNPIQVDSETLVHLVID